MGELSDIARFNSFKGLSPAVIRSRLVSVAPFAVAFANQAIASAANFFFVIYLLRILVPTEFGLYSIAFAVMLGGSAVTQGMFQVQMLTRLPERNHQEQPRFAFSVFVLQSGACVGLFALVAVGSSLFGLSVEHTSYLLAIVAGIAALSGKEFIVRYLFAHGGRHTTALCVNLVLCTAWLGAVLAGPTIASATSALLTYAFAHAVGVLAGIRLAHFVRLMQSKLDIGESWLEIRQGGLWASASALIFSARQSAHTFVLAALAAPSDVALMNAGRTFVTPATIFIPTMSNVLLPRLVQANHDVGATETRRLAITISLVLGGIVMVFVPTLWLCWDIIRNQVLNEDYAGVGPIVALWCLYALALALRNGLEWGLQAIRRFATITLINSTTTVVTLLLVCGLTWHWGMVGAICGAIAGEIMTAAAFLWTLAHLEQASKS